MGVKEAAEFLGLRVTRYCGRQSHAKSFSARPLDSRPGACPCPLPTMAFVALRRGAVEADLQGDAFARQRAQRYELASGKQHSVGEDRGGRRRSAGNNDLANIRQHKGLAAGDKNFSYAERCGFDCDPSHAFDTKRPPRSFGGRAYATIVAAQIAVEVGVKP